jgi:membrane-bound lytic murein transglycosylase F
LYVVYVVRRIGIALLTALILIFVGCRPEPRRTDGYAGVVDRGELRVIVRPGFLRAPPTGDHTADEMALLRQLAGRLNARVRWIESPRHDQLIQWLEQGRGDIAVARFGPSSLLDSSTRPSAGIDWVEDLLVVGEESSYSSFGELEGGTVHLHASAMSATLLASLQEEGLEVLPVPEEVPLEEVLRRVRAGRYEMTVTDSDLLEAGRGRSGLRVLGPVAERRPLVWAIRKSDQRLRRAVDDFLFAERVLARASKTATCRDLRLVKQARVLRLITRNSPTTCTVKRGGLEGFEYDLALAFAAELGVRLELSIPPPEVDPLDWLERGHGDILALHEPVAPEDEGRFLTSVSYRSVDLLAVVSRRREPPGAVEELAGLEVAATRPVASLCRLLPLAPPIRSAEMRVGADSLSALLEVSRGLIEVAVVDRDTLRLELDDRPDLQLGPVILPSIPLVWIANVSSPRLHAAMDRFLRRARVSGLARQLAASELGSWQPYVPPDLPKIPDGALTPYDELLQYVGRTHGIDWRLLASLMYEESRFDPDAVGPGGSAGLFQFMPFTWRDLGVEDPHHPGEAAEAGGWYLRWLMDKFSDLELPDQVAMAIASYNVGPRHVFDARRLAREMKLDPDRWRGNVETAMLIIDDPEVARRFPAGVCRCRRAVGYTRRILRRYQAYTEQFPPQ